MISLDGQRAHDLDTLVVGAIALATLTAQPVELLEIPRGLSSSHLMALRAFAPLCAAGVEGDEPRSRFVRFVPSRPARGRQLTVQPMGPASVSALVPFLLPVLAAAEGDSLLTLRGTTVAPDGPSAHWLREVLTPTLAEIGIAATVEIERWGWYPDGGGTLVVAVEGGWLNQLDDRLLVWDEPGQPIALHALVASSRRDDPSWASQSAAELRRAIEGEPLPPLDVEIQQVDAPGPGSALFATLHCEQASVGFHALRERVERPSVTATRLADALLDYLWADVATDSQVAEAMLIPLALTRQPAMLTTNRISPALKQLGVLVERFLPTRVTFGTAAGRGTVTFDPR